MPSAICPNAKLVLSLYYDEELNLKEIGRVLGVSESRVSQLHSQCAARLRARLANGAPIDNCLRYDVLGLLRHFGTYGGRLGQEHENPHRR